MNAAVNGSEQPYQAAAAETEIDSLLEAAQVEPANVLTAAKVGRLVEMIAGYAGAAQTAGLEALRTLIGHLPAEERERIQTDLYAIFPRNQDLEAFLSSCPAPPGEPIFRPLSFADLLSRPPKEWLISEVLGAGDIGMLYGPPGSGKSFIVIDMIFAACLGQEWALRFDIQRPLSVAYCAGEGLGGLPQRFAAAAQHYGVADLQGFTFFDTAPQLYAPERGGEDIAAETIGRFVRDWVRRQEEDATGALDLLIVDTLHSATAGADENSAQDMGQVLQAVKAASKALGCAVLLVHHSNKAGTGERGSSAMRGAMDFMLEVKPTAGKFALECAKLKDAGAWKAQTFDLVSLADSARVWWDEPGVADRGGGQQAAALLAELSSRPGVGFTAKQLAEAVGAGQSATINALARLVDKGEIRRRLQDESRPPSNRNPWVYMFGDSS